MKKTLLIAILMALLAGFVNAEKVAEIDLTIYKNDTAVLYSFRAYEGMANSIPLESSDYILEIKNKNGETSSKVYLPVAFLLLSDPPQEIDFSPISIEVPYSSEWKTLEVYHNSKLIFVKDIENYFCNNNNICEQNENYVSCPSDCTSGSKDGWCDRVYDNKCDPDCLQAVDIDCNKINEEKLIVKEEELIKEQDKKQEMTLPKEKATETPKKKQIQYLPYILILGTLIALVSIIYFIRNRRTK